MLDISFPEIFGHFIYTPPRNIDSQQNINSYDDANQHFVVNHVARQCINKVYKKCSKSNFYMRCRTTLCCVLYIKMSIIVFYNDLKISDADAFLL